MHGELLTLFPGCSSFEAENFGNQSVKYLMKMLEIGRRLKYEQLHWASVMPAHQLAQNFNLQRTTADIPPAKADDYLVFKKLAYPDKEVKFSEITIATIQAISKIPHPFWIHCALPWSQLLSVKSKADPAELLMLCSKNMVLIAPIFNQGWISCELAAFEISEKEAGQVITLYHPDTNKPVIDLKLRRDIGQGYYQDEQFKVLKFHEVELAHA